METRELELLHQKLDMLNERLESQQVTPASAASPNGKEWAVLNQKVDFLLEQMEAQRRRQDELEELKNDLVPMANHMIKLSIDELAEIGTEFQLEDLLFLVKRVLRDTHLLLDLLDRLESLAELADETQGIGQQIFHQSVLSLDRLEREGYFTFAAEGWKVLERIVQEFEPEDIQALGDNVVTILTTIRNLTQPEIMTLTNNALGALRDEPEVQATPSAWALARELSDPQVRRGMARLLNLVKVLAEQPSVDKN